MSTVLEKEKKQINKKTTETEKISELIKKAESERRKAKLEKSLKKNNSEASIQEKINEIKCSVQKIEKTIESFEQTDECNIIFEKIDIVNNEISEIVSKMSEFRDNYGNTLLIPEEIFKKLDKSLSFVSKVLKNIKFTFNSIDAFVKAASEIGENPSNKKIINLQDQLENMCYLIETSICSIPTVCLKFLMDLSLEILEYFPKEKLLEQSQEKGFDKTKTKKFKKELIRIRTSCFFIYKSILNFIDFNNLEWEEEVDQEESTNISLIKKFLLDNKYEKDLQARENS